MLSTGIVFSTKSFNKCNSSWTKDFTVALINTFKYNNEYKYFKNNEWNIQIFDEIGQFLEKDPKKVLQKWSLLMKKLLKERKRPNSKWMYLEDLSFVKDKHIVVSANRRCG